MSLLPVNTCTTYPYDANNAPSCNSQMVHNMATYPSGQGCADKDSSSNNDNDKHCYVALNGNSLTDEEDIAFTQVLKKCCRINDHAYSGVGFAGPCAHDCKQNRGLEFWNDCLEEEGFGPSYNDTGIVRDTYCVKGKDVESVKKDDVANAASTVGGKTGTSSKATLAIGALFLTYAFIS